MEKRLSALLKEVDTLLDLAPCEDDCSDAENDVYCEMANLKNALENAGCEEAFYAEKKEAEKKALHCISVVDSAGYETGKESDLRVYTDLKKCIDDTYYDYKTTWGNLISNGTLDEEYLEIEEMEMLSRDSFEKELLETEYVLIQLRESHIQFEYFKKDIPWLS